MIQSLNFRLADAMPQSVLERWQVQLAADSDAIRAAELRRRVDEYLDAGYGACWLRKPESPSWLRLRCSILTPEGTACSRGASCLTTCTS